MTTDRTFRSNWTLILGLTLCVVAVLCGVLFPWNTFRPSILVFSFLPLGFVLLVIGCLKLAYADGATVIIGLRHEIGVCVGLVMLWSVALYLFPVAAVGACVFFGGCYPWASKLPGYVTLPLGAVLVGIACSAKAYVPVLFVPLPPAGPDDVAGGLMAIHLFSFGVPGIVFMLSGIARVIGIVDLLGGRLHDGSGETEAMSEFKPRPPSQNPYDPPASTPTHSKSFPPQNAEE